MNSVERASREIGLSHLQSETLGWHINGLDYNYEQVLACALAIQRMNAIECRTAIAAFAYAQYPSRGHNC